MALAAAARRRRRAAGARPTRPARPSPPRRSTPCAAARRISDLFARHGVQDLDLTGLEPGARSTRAGCAPAWSFSFRQQRTGLAAQPHHRPDDSGAAGRLPAARQTGGDAVVEPIAWRAEEVRIEGGDRQLAVRGARRAGARDEQLDGADRQRLAWDLADVYAWQVDFTRDIQPGDRFQVVFERLVSEDGEVRFGRVLASDLTMSGKSLTAFRFEGDGRPALLRRRRQLAPPRLPPRAGPVPPDLLDLRPRAASIRCSGITRRHEGTDYAASPGHAGHGRGRRRRAARRARRRVRQPDRAAPPERDHHPLRPPSRLRPRASAPARGSSRDRRSATSARPASPAARTCTTSSG